MAPLPPPPPPPPRLPPPPPPPVSGEPQIVHHTYDHATSRWGLGDAFLSMVVFFGVSLIVGLAAFGLTDTDSGLDGAWLPAAIAIPPVVQLAHITWVARSKGNGLAADLQLRFTLSDLGIGAGLCMSGLILAGITAAGVMEIFGEEPSAAAADLVQDSEGGGGLTIWIYIFAILAATLIPLVEELVYRGLWWSALEKRGLHPVLILVITSGIFAIVHLEPLRTPVLFVLGMAIGLGRLVTGRIAASIFAHVYVNAIGMIFLLIELS